jgi:cytochrome c oxidase assembly factor CtaG/ferredoxin
MNTIGSAVLSSWTLDPLAISLFAAIALVYVRGWLRGRRFSRGEGDLRRLGCFLSGLAVLFLALESPLDAFAALFLWAHMTQHLLLMMIAPPLLLLGDPAVPLLRGLPRTFVKEGLAPFLAWPALKRVLRWIVSPPVAWFAFAVSTIAWHLPALYELALQSPFWHAAQHASFFWTGILFWWPVLESGHGRDRWPRWTMIPYLLLGDILNTALSAFLIFSDRVLYPSYEAVRVTGLSARQDQAAAGAIMWVPGSIVYLVPAVVIAVRLFSPARIRERRWPNPWRSMRPKRLPLPLMRRIAQTAMLALAIAVMWDGFFGTQVAAVNLAGTLPWVHWRALSMLALILAGNLFCMVCPFTLARDIGRRLFHAKLRWPRRLRSKWIPVTLLAVYLWAYDAFKLWDSPWLTASLIAGYFAAALIVDGTFRGASFCKYVCPIGQFHFVSSLVSPGEIRARSLEVCRSCRTHDCIHGNERARGCELNLFQPKKAGNMDCTFCLDCVNACPHDNVALMPVVPAATLTVDPYRSSLGRLSKRTDIAVLAAVIVFGSLVNAGGMVSSVMEWEHRWHALLGMNLVAACLVAGALILSGLAVLLCGMLNRLVPLSRKLADVARQLTLALVPLGTSIWAAHLLYHLATLRLLVPAWLRPAQIVFLDAGLLLTLYVCWRVAAQSAPRRGYALALTAPWALLSCAVYAGGIWIFFQPMQMQGMLH